MSVVRESSVTPGERAAGRDHWLIGQIVTDCLMYPGSVRFTNTVLQGGTNVYIGLLCHLNDKMVCGVLRAKLGYHD